jgi:protein-S-isoprenylcysteine O-methyltransferase Ste14
MKNFLSAIMIVVLGLALFSPAYPFVLYAVGPRTSLSLLFSVFFSVIALEKVYAMFIRMRQKDLVKVERDWTSAAVGISYTLVMYLALVEFYWVWQKGMSWSLTIIGAALYVGAVSLRYWAFRHLGRQWVVHLDRNDADERVLIQDGPYACIRHPLYAGACLEALAVPLIFNGVGAAVLACLTFIPLEVKRARFEEEFLRRTFGPAYDDYTARVGGFFPRSRCR